MLEQRGTNGCTPKLFRNKEKKKVLSEKMWIKEEQTEVF